MNDPIEFERSENGGLWLPPEVLPPTAVFFPEGLRVLRAEYACGVPFERELTLVGEAARAVVQGRPLPYERPEVRMITATEASEIVGCSASTIKRRCAPGHPTSIRGAVRRPDGVWLVPAMWAENERRRRTESAGE